MINQELKSRTLEDCQICLGPLEIQIFGRFSDISIFYLKIMRSRINPISHQAKLRK